jgi:alkylation response protein AidB-like acyl-CoA dehydrogenase
MSVELTDEQLELQRVAREVVEAQCPASLVRAVVEDDEDTTALWKGLVDLEWPGLALAVEDGGSGATAVELGLLVEQLGWAADPTPFLATTTQHLPLVREGQRGPARAERLAAVVAGSPGAAVLDPTCCTARRDGDAWRVRGSAAHVLDGDRAEALAIVATTDEGLACLLIPTADAAVAREPSTDGSLHLATVRLDDVLVDAGRVTTGPEVESALAAASAEALVGLSAAVVGASQRVFDLVLEHVRTRRQFGVPIGSFQAVKHMAVDVYLAIERARAVGQRAAQAVAEGSDGRSLLAAMAKAAAGDAQRLTVQHGIQLFGALGYTWENDLQLFLKRAKTLDVLLGTAREHRQVLARAALADPARAVAQQPPAADDETEAFRQELGAWLDANAPSLEEAAAERSHSSADIPSWARRFQRAMFEAGWLLPGNPPEHGGRNASLREQLVHQEELNRRRIYLTFNPQGLSIIVPSILAFGTAEQQQRWAVPIMRAELTAALGMSEPDAGSDLAGLRTRAVLDGDRFVVNGQKVWTSGAHDADLILAFVRTDPDAPKHRGISCLVIPTDTPGVTRRPFRAIQGKDELDFNEVFFDDAVVPAENLIGELHQGWRVATGSLGHERAMLWLGYAERLDDLIVRGAQVVRDHGLEDDAYVQEWFAQLVTDSHALRALGERVMAKVQRGMEPVEQSILKLLGSEAVQRATLHVLEACGPDALDPTVRTGPPEPLNLDVWGEGWFDLYLRSFSATIAGGTSQIQRNIVGEHVLGLPR